MSVTVLDLKPSGASFDKIKYPKTLKKKILLFALNYYSVFKHYYG